MYIQVSHISKSYGGQEILSDISFTISDTQKVAILGKNGSGKSTLLKIIVGEESADSGQVSKSPKQLKIGYLPQIIDSISSLSSGQKLKERFTYILSTYPDILLLDEPTNHLDTGSLGWLEQEVKKFPGPVLLISHDRAFLDNTVDRILELVDGRLYSYGGNFTFYKQQKALMLEANRRQYSQQQKKLNQLADRADIIKNRTQQLEISTTGTDHYARRKAAKSARSALAMEKRIRKEIDGSTIPAPAPNWELKALFTPNVEGNQTVMHIKSLFYKSILSDFSLLVTRGQKIALTGPNGSGKTTLIRLILGEIMPDIGEITLGSSTQIGYLSQEHRELSSDLTVLEELESINHNRTESYQLLRRFLLPPEKINQPVSLLSSGEKSKLLLAKIMASGANFIILDEPTNHLDIPSREAVESALAHYPGTLLIVSHDRYFLSRVGITKEVVISQT